MITGSGVEHRIPPEHAGRDDKTPSSYLFFNSRSSSVIIETGKRRTGRALRAHRRGLLLLLEPLEELDARLGLDLLAGLAADLLGVGRRADLARAVDLGVGNWYRNPDLYV